MLTLGLLTALTVLFVGLVIASTCIRTVQPLQALLVRERVTGSVRHKVIAGPTITAVLPFIDETVTLDLSLRVVSQQFEDIITQDSFLVAASLDVGFNLDAELLRKVDLDRLLPFLTGDLNRIVSIWANHILRALLMGFSSRELTTRPDLRSRLERQFLQVLQDRLAIFGIRAGVARLLIRPIPAWEIAQLAAKQTQLAAEARAQGWAALASAVGSRQDLTQLMQLEMLFDGLGVGDNRLHPFIDVPAAGGGNNGGLAGLHWMLDPRKEVSLS